MKKVEIPLKEFLIQRIVAKYPRTIRELFEIVKEKRPAISEQEFIQAVKELRETGVLGLELPIPEARSYRSYLRLLDENVWFYLVLVTASATLLSIYMLPSIYPLVIIRWILGSIFVLFLPGYVTVQALFPEGKELDSIERVALTIGLSLALTPLIGLVLNYTPWGIRLNPIVTALTLFTIGLAMIGTVRRYGLLSKKLTRQR
jgi:hypothetical protein